MNDHPTLRDLVLRAKDERGAPSMRQLALFAQQHGHRIVDTTLNGIAGGTYKSRPSTDTLRAIAWLAGVDDGVAFRAAGLRVPGPPFAEELPPGVDYLSADARKAVIGLLRVLVQHEEVVGDAHQRDAAPMTLRAVPAPHDDEDDISSQITLNPAASDAEEGEDPDDEVRAQQEEP